MWLNLKKNSLWLHSPKQISESHKADVKLSTLQDLSFNVQHMGLKDFTFFFF